MFSLTECGLFDATLHKSRFERVRDQLRLVFCIMTENMQRQEIRGEFVARIEWKCIEQDIEQESL